EDAISQHLNQQKVSRDNHRLNDDDVDTVCDRFAVLVGRKIIELITGRVSTEVPARFSFDTDATVAKARTLIDLYNAEGIATDRVLIKVAGTWEGIRAAEILEKSGIQCNVTLIFNAAQAAASAEAGAYLISPFVGRILDWHTAHRGFSDPNPAHDPGVISVRTIYHYFKTKGLNTIVMGASFRNTGEIIALAGCDRLTISPALLSELASDHETIITRQLSPTGETQAVTGIDVTNIDTDEPDFRWQLNHDEMAHFKLAEGIRKFHSDYEALRAAIKAR
ncbi:MAG: transaldolase family protein, partial [Gammaproteobacteria bacterium]